MRTNTIVTLVIIVVILLVAGIFTYTTIKNKSPKINEDTKQIFADDSTDFHYTDINGNEISLEQYLGRVLVVTSWASWSPYSESDLTALNDLSNNYSENEVIFMAINRKETKEMAERFLNTQPEYSNLLLVLDPTDHFYNAVAGYAMPETVIFDQAGEISLHIKGVADTNDIKDQVEILINNET